MIKKMNKIIINIKKREKKRKEIILVFLLLIFSQDSFVFNSLAIEKYPYSSLLSKFRYLVIFFFIIFYLIKIIKKRSISYRYIPMVKIVIFIIIWIILSMVLNNDFEGMYSIMSIVIACEIILLYEHRVFIYAFYKVIFIVSIISIIFWLTVHLFSIQMNRIIYMISDNSLNNIILKNFLIMCHGMYGWNAAIFRERGVFCLYLVLAIIYCIMLKKKSNKYNISGIIIYTVAILTTKGSSGIIGLTIIIIGWIWRVQKTKKIQKQYVIILCVGIIVSPFIIPGALSEIIMKMDFGGIKADSGIARVASLVVPSVSMFNHPIFGIGAGNFNLQYQILSMNVLGVSSTSFTNTIFGLGAYYGVPIMIILLIGLYKYCKKIAIANKSDYIYYFIALFFQFICQQENCSAIFWILILSGFIKGALVDGNKEKNSEH